MTSEPGSAGGSAPAEQNPLLAEWSGPYGGVPPFQRVEVAHFEPALEAAMRETLAEIERIAGDPAPPTFENTLVPLERSGRTLHRVRAVYEVWSTTMSGPAFREVEREMAPRLAAFADRVTQNEALFRRIEAVYQALDRADRSPEQQRLAWFQYTRFVRAGAQLDAAGKARLSEINQRLAGLFTRFSQNVLADETDHFLLLDDEAELAGLPESLREAAAAAAEERGLPGNWVIENTRSAVEPFLTFAERRELRERAWRMWARRGDMGGENDNRAIISEILRLRAERAGLLGFASHAHWRLDNTMAKTPERALELMHAVWAPAMARVREEVAELQAAGRADGAAPEIQPWDYRYYAEKVLMARFELDQNEVKPYLQLERLREAMFWVASQLFGLDFSPVERLPVNHPDVRVWEAREAESGRHLGLFYFDPYARQGKRSGAWMNAYRRQENVDGRIAPIVSNNSNFVAGRPGEPVLISWSDARTLFHEFGHALHGLASDVAFPSLAGTSVDRDFVEFPSQLLEHWLTAPEVLQRFAVHHRSGEPIPPELVDRIERAATFNKGSDTIEYLASALVDMRLHLAGGREIEPAAFEAETLRELGMPDEVAMRHRPPHFAHIFSGDGYAAGYYSYLWADVLTADAYEAFLEGGGAFDREVAERLYRHVLSIGNTVDPAESYRRFRGRDAGVGALMRKRGFPIEALTQGDDQARSRL